MTTRTVDSDTSLQTPVRAETAVLTAVSEAIQRLRFGVVQLTVHDGRVVQLDVTDRQRFV